MRKERNNFFQESGYNQGYFYNNQMMPMPQMEASSSFYMNQGSQDIYDYQVRISRLERQVNRLESRVSKIENNNNFSSSIDEETKDINNNLYIL